jgi:HEAT repeat protein
VKPGAVKPDAVKPDAVKHTVTQRPRAPGRRLDPAAVIAALEEPTPDRRPTMTHLEAHASPRALAGALAIAVLPFTRQLIADLLGRQADPAGAAALLSALADRNPRVRSSAADALGKIMRSHGPASVPGAGPALLAAYTAEDSAGARHMLAAALGAAGERAAIPLLEAAAASEDPGLARSVSWALAQIEGRGTTAATPKASHG